MSNLPIFSHPSFGTVRIVERNDEPWFVAKDVAKALGYASTNMTTIFQAVPEEWKGSNPITTLGGEQEMLIISEQGLYFFLGRSDKPVALPFQKWLAGDVIPSIRKHGLYATSSHYERNATRPGRKRRKPGRTPLHGRPQRRPENPQSGNWRRRRPRRKLRRRNGTPRSRRSRGTGTNSGASCGRQCGMTKRLAIGVLLLCLPLFSGCSGRREVAAVPLVIREEVPVYLTEPTPAPVLAGDTNLDLVGHVFDWQAALGACNADKAAIRAAAGKE